MGSVRSIEVVQKEIEGAFAELATLSPTDLTGAEVADYVERSQRIRSLADAHCVRSAGVLDTSKAWSVDGAKSPTAWIAWRCHIARGRASAAVVGARALRQMPLTEAALLAGRITLEHVRRIADALAAAPEAFAEDEARLVRAAAEQRYDTFDRVVRYWTYHQAPDDEEGKARRRRDERGVSCSRSFEGMLVIDALLDPITGEIFARELERLERVLFEEDLAEARERVGPSASLQDLRRTPRQRRADAMRLMAERSAAKPADATEPRILLQVLAGHESVDRMCELSNRQVVTPGEILPVLHQAEVERIVFDGPSKVIDVGVRQRLFRGATRTAVQARDRECDHPTCDVPAERCEIDHIHPFAEGGLTVQDNGRCRCKYHHRRTPPAP